MGSYAPPFGSQDVPHPRLPLDILIRTLAIQGFAAIAYGHLLYLLSFRKPHGVGTLPILLIPAFICLPELLLIQAAFSLIPICVAKPYRRRVASRFKALPFDLGLISSTSINGLPRLGAHAAFAVFNALPLAAVLGAYRQRLRMTYHQMSFIANLGLDHRNGWAAFAGMLAVGLTLAVVVMLVIIILAGEAEPARDELPQAEMQSGHARSLSVAALLKKALGSDHGDVDWGSILDLLYACSVHQFVLGVTNHPVPVLFIFKVWYLWPVAGLTMWWLIAKQNVPVDLVAMGNAVFLIVLTAVSPIVWDLLELYWVSHGQMEQWNFRWKVKDWVSLGHVPDS